MGQMPVVGVVGTSAGDPQAIQTASVLGELLAREGWVVLSGGRNAGVMAAVSHGAKKANGLTVGILPDRASAVAPDVDIAIITDLHNARNNVIALSSNVVIACGVGGPGTASEVALALKNQKTVILLQAEEIVQAFFKRMGRDQVHIAATPVEAVRIIKEQRLC